ncbi:MAG: glycosyl transferase family 1, partial [Kiritimatiellaceae bacterium]|nr:glycosyl transferase family 1 [Kiritimatiellaceae bacterium]
DPFVRRTAKKATVAYASTKETAHRLHCMGLNRVQIQTQIGMHEDEVKYKPSSSTGCIFISIGRMIHWKGFMLGIKAFSRLNEKTSQYWLIGDGPCRHRLKKYVQENDLKERVHFFGSMTRADVQKKLSEANVLVHPSYHDSAGLVCLEAMALGKPVICLDTGGPALLVNETAGYRSSVESEHKALNDIKNAMKLFIEDSNLLTDMAERACDRVRKNFLWNNKVLCFSKQYFEVCDENCPNP